MVETYGMIKAAEEKPAGRGMGLRERKIILFCWIFILGVAVATAFFHGVSFRDWEIILPESFLILPQYLPIAWITIAILAALTAFFFYKDKAAAAVLPEAPPTPEKPPELSPARMKWTTPSLVILALLLGIACYTNKVDTSSPHHLNRFLSKDWGDKRVVIGKIWKEPEVRYHTDPETGEMVEKDTYLILRPSKIQREPPDGPFVEKVKGDILVKISPMIGEVYRELSPSEALGYTVKLHAPLFAEQPANNPGGFDYKKYLMDSGIYAQSPLTFPSRWAPPIEILNETRGRLWVETALIIKKKMLAVFKKTMPYPESAFLGGVTLGLRHGLIKLHRYPWSPLSVEDAFRHAGTIHVIAVSGLHVTVIAGLLFGLSLLLFKSREKAAAFTLFFMIFFALMIFTALTGARPSTMRAFIMASIVLLLWAMGTGLRYSLLLGIPISATLILIYNPLFLTEASFTLSFGAVLSLGLITAPTMKYLRKLKGLPSVTLLVIAFIFPLISYFQKEAFKELYTMGQFIIFAFLLLVVSYIIQKRHHFAGLRKVANIILYREKQGGFKSIEELAQVPGMDRGTFQRLKGKIENITTISSYALGNLIRGGPLFRFGLGDGNLRFVLAQWFFAFLCAQVAINLGMMFPLSLYYFKHVPYAGPYANFMAIPLITTIIPLGIMAGVLGMIIPWLGQYLALLINAGNWLLVKLFLWLSYAATNIFRYPFELTPTVYQLTSYFSLVLVYVYFDDLHQKLTCPDLKSIEKEMKGKETQAEFSEEIEKLKEKRKGLVRGRICAWIVVGLVVLLFFIASLSAQRKPVLKVLYLSVGYGDSILIQTPEGKNILIDGGYRSPTWDTGERYIAPVLVKEGIKRLDAVVLTNPSLEHMGGLISILKNFEVNQFIDSLGPGQASPDMSYDEFLTLMNEKHFLENRDEPATRQTYETYLELLRVLKERMVVHKKGTYGTIIAKERFRGRDLELYILNPMEPRIENAYSNLSANSIVMRLIYGNNTFLFTSNLGPEGEARLVASGNVLRGDILQIPAHGSLLSSTPNFLRAVNPRVAVLSYGNAKLSGRDKREAKRLEKEMQETLAKYRGEVEKYYTTDRYTESKDMAVIITSDGKRYWIESMRSRSRHERPLVLKGS
ncbi:ComEC/Rec2 family competence protein [bacterium]|nr:ComEC/Rec2 family competence protein [bacterium]